MILLSLLLALLCAACSGGEKGESEALLLRLGFDEGSGNQVSDGAERVQPAEVNYLFTNAAYMENRDPEWRAQGVQGGCLLFDGCSNYIGYEPEELLVQGEALSISLWAAPRAFEWDDPNAAANGTENLTALVGQYNRDKKQGFLLGYERYGRLCFQVGTGEDFLTLWADGGNLNKYQWNHVAAVFDGKAGSMTLYLNGSPVGELSLPAGRDSSPTGLPLRYSVMLPAFPSKTAATWFHWYLFKFPPSAQSVRKSSPVPTWKHSRPYRS